jgi:putative holliday junction resolvase
MNNFRVVTVSILALTGIQVNVNTDAFPRKKDQRFTLELVPATRRRPNWCEVPILLYARGLVCSNNLMPGRILALDYGTKNIGIAWCDELQVTIQPLPSIPRMKQADLLAHLQKMILRHEIREMVIGLPINMDGSSGEAAQKVARFARFLQGNLSIPLSHVDERLSTVEALEVWNRMSPRQKQKYRTVDSLAAANILRRYLEEI